MDKLLGLLKNLAPGIATLVAGPAGGLVVTALAKQFGVADSVEEVAKAIVGDPLAAQKLAEMDLEKYRVDQEAVTSRWQADLTSDSKLAKNIRPMVLIYILTAYVAFALLDGAGYSISEAYVNLLGQWGMLVMTAYFGGRTIEKLFTIKNQK